MATERIEILRRDAVENPAPSNVSAEMRYLYARGWQQAAGEPRLPRRQTLARAAVLRGMTPVINRHELIVGRQNFDVSLTDAQREFTELAQSLIPQRHGQDSHMALDYEKLLSCGTEGVRAEIERHMAGLNPDENPDDLPKQLFYEDCITMLCALEDLAAHYAAHARELAAGETPERRAELERIAENLSVVPRHPARTFWQALQSVHMLIFHLEGLYQAGRPDQYLWEYYRRDVESGTLTRERALELIDCFCILLNKTVPRGLAVGLMVGGRAPDGTPVENELTHLFIQSIGDTRMSYPGIGLCVTPTMSDELMRLAVSMLGAGYTHPALFNDEVITQGLMELGLPFEEAVNYIHSTCVEITPVKRSAVWVASPYFNLMQPLMDIMEAAPEYEDFDALYSDYRRRLRALINEGAREQNMLRMERERFYSHPLVSCFVDDCLERGADLDDGGARYNFIMPSFVGMANLVDALTAIRHLVFEEHAVSLKRYSEALHADFAGYEWLLERINALPRYGNDADEPDALAREFTNWLPGELAKVRGFKGCRFVPSMFCWIMHAELGKQTGATPDGRRAGFPLGDGSGPAQGRELCGPTASILSSTCWRHTPFIGGVAVNVKFSRAMFDGQALDKLCDMVRVYMERGGFELQVNAVNREELLDARRNPDAHRDLVVRIGGYSDYFTHLSPQMQDEVLLRTEHEL